MLLFLEETFKAREGGVALVVNLLAESFLVGNNFYLINIIDYIATTCCQFQKLHWLISRSITFPLDKYVGFIILLLFDEESELYERLDEDFSLKIYISTH